MKIQVIIYQQISQLKWHILICLGLVMVLPVEELIVGFKDGHGFSGGMTLVFAFMIAPLLAGLIACSNVQADMNDKLYIFWRSKPAGIKLMVAIKYFIGLAISIFIFACPIIFGFIVSFFYQEKVSSDMTRLYIPLCFVLTILIYSFCFGLNVLIRNTARGWLIGILLTGFFLILPFLLPLNFKDIYSVFELFTRSFIIFIFIISGAAFVLSLFSAQHDWHLKTNLKSLLWVISGLVFVLLMLFSSQVANIKVLDEKQITDIQYSDCFLDYIGDKVVFRQTDYLNTENNKISLSKVEGSLGQAIQAGLFGGGGGYNSDIYPHDGRLIKQIGNEYYCFYINAQFDLIEQEPRIIKEYKQVTLNCYKIKGSSWIPVSNIDLSDCIDGKKSYIQMAMRIIDNKLFAFVDRSLATVDITNPEGMKKIDTKFGILPGIRYYYFNSNIPYSADFDIPLIPGEGISEEEKIKLSLDWYFNTQYMYESSVVDIFDNKICFYGYNFSNNFVKYEVTGWDKEKIYCKMIKSRQLTFLEGLAESWINKVLIKNGKYYFATGNTLMVFDIRTDNGFRKLGHFVRMDYAIKDMAVLEDGNIAIQLGWEHLFDVDKSGNSTKYYLCLLKDPS